jgi:two-component system, chemotaxis family, chemotaxis protein CheY
VKALPKLNVLVVDDSASIRKIVRTILVQMGMEVQESADGQTALDILAYWPAELVLVDFEMQPMDGETLVKTIRKGEGLLNPLLPILMMTAHADASHVMRARQAGVDGLIVKPFSLGVITERIEAVLGVAAKRHAEITARPSVQI